MNKPMQTYSESFMDKAAIKHGNDAHGYLTLKLPLVVDAVNTHKLWDASNAVCFTWNQLTDHQNGTSWADGYFEIKKLIPDIKNRNLWLKTTSSQVLQEVAKSHTGATKGCKTKRSKRNKVTGAPAKEAKANFPGFKSRKYFQSHKYPQQGISFTIEGKILRLAHGSRPNDWIVVELPHTVAEDSVKAITITYDDKTGFSACLETKFELPKVSSNYHVLVVDPGCKTAMTCMRSDGTIWEYDISKLRNLNMKIFKKLDDLMSQRDVLPCSQRLAEYWKARAAANRFVGPQPEGYVQPSKPKLSRMYKRLAAKITASFASIKNRSKQYLHTVAKQILKDHPMVSNIFIGDWSKKDTVADTPFKAVNERINRAVQNNNPTGRLIEYLQYKAAHAAKQVDKFDERGTTKTCSACDHVGEAVPPTQRTFTCRKCGFIAPRDVNATLNQTKLVAYGMWHALKAIPAFSNVKTSLPGLSCVNPKRLRSLLSLSTGMHRVY
jgi:putative transposase